MIVQCEACQTRFRLADEKIKPGGTKVRCSKCKEIFVVSLPEPEPEPATVPEPVEEAVDFGSFNMEKVSGDDASESAPEDSREDADIGTEPASASGESAEPTGADESVQSDELDFSALESELVTDGSLGNELADDFSFADTSQPAGDEAGEQVTADSDFGDALTEPAPAVTNQEESTDFGAVFEETDEPGSSLDLEFKEDFDLETESATETGPEVDQESEFSFDDGDDEEQESQNDSPDEFDFDDHESSEGDYSFDGTDEEPAADNFGEQSPSGEFSFDDNADSAWDDDTPGAGDSFDFDEPKFDQDDVPSSSSASDAGEDGLQFGEIDFASDDVASEGPKLETADDFGSASLEKHDEEPEPFAHSQQEDRPPRSYEDDDDTPLRAPPPQKKSSLSRILVLLILLLLILGGAAGYLFMQEGAVNLSTIVRYLPFLQEYVGEPVSDAAGDRIGINIAGSSYINGQAGQMLIIQGAAVNNYPTSRSAIAVKGVLLDANGKTLLQQTVFCGNKLDDATLKTSAFAAIEEAMNNPFGNATSNMNVAAGASIPFTIVFRNLPTGIANINVEVVDSKPGAG